MDGKRVEEIKTELSGSVQTREILYIPTFNIESITFKFAVEKMLDACLNYHETPRQNPKKRNYKHVSVEVALHLLRRKLL
jgi:hypothetical protein